MEIVFEEIDGATCLKVKGELNISTSAEFEKALLSAIEENPQKLMIDISELSFLSSAGIRSLIVGGQKIAKGKGTLTVLANPKGIINEVLDISGLSHILNIKYTSPKE